MRHGRLEKADADEAAVNRVVLPPKDEAISLLRTMQLIRAFEEQVRSLFFGGMIPGSGPNAKIRWTSAPARKQ